MSSVVDQSLSFIERSKLTNRMAEAEESLVEIFTGPFERASVIRALLEAYGLQVFLRDSTLGIENPSYCEPSGRSRIFKVLVRQRDYYTAQSIIEAPPEQNPSMEG
jgi:hypothetical protein